MRTMVVALISIGLLLNTSVPMVAAEETDCEELLEEILDNIAFGEPIEELLEEFAANCPDIDDLVPVGGAGYWEFSSDAESVCSDWVCIHPQTQMALAARENCEPNIEPGQDCLMVTASVRAISVYPASPVEEQVYGEFTALGSMHHMSQESCAWDYFPDPVNNPHKAIPGCTYVHVDPDTGSPSHFHAHNRDGNEYCHDGDTGVKTSEELPSNWGIDAYDIKSCGKYVGE